MPILVQDGRHELSQTGWFKFMEVRNFDRGVPIPNFGTHVTIGCVGSLSAFVRPIVVVDDAYKTKLEKERN